MTASYASTTSVSREFLRFLVSTGSDSDRASIVASVENVEGFTRSLSLPVLTAFGDGTITGV
jgi:hypothetical protein